MFTTKLAGDCLMLSHIDWPMASSVWRDYDNLVTDENNKNILQQH